MSRASGAGSFGNGPNIYQQSPTEFDKSAHAALNGESRFDDSSPRFEDWSPEKQRSGYEGMVRADEKRTVSMKNADEFILLNPHILDTEKNGKLIYQMASTMFGSEVAFTVEHYKAATDALLVTNSLDIDKAEVAKQQQKALDAQRKAAIKNRADAAARAFDPNADYESLSLEEIRKRSDEELRQQMQAAGERGGLGL